MHYNIILCYFVIYYIRARVLVGARFSYVFLSEHNSDMSQVLTYALWHVCCDSCLCIICRRNIQLLRMNARVQQYLAIINSMGWSTFIQRLY